MSAAGEAAAGASPRALRAHYDRGNAFYAAWLDPAMSYSAGRWERADGRAAATLEEAQRFKIDWHLASAGIGPGARLLDVGCGWGALLSRAVTAREAAEAVGLTPAREQARWIAAHLPDPRIRVVESTWQEARLDAPFDAVVSVGALEHFARPGASAAAKRAAYRRFFEFCTRALVADGRLSLQFIGWMDIAPEAEAKALPEALFPESTLPRLPEVLAASEGRFHLLALENRPGDYSLTLRAWLARMQAGRDDLIARHGKDLVRTYTRAFRRFVLGFEAGTLGLYRASFRPCRGALRGRGARD